MKITLLSGLIYGLLIFSSIGLIALPADAALKGTISQSDNPTSQDVLSNDLPTEIDAAVPRAPSRFDKNNEQLGLVPTGSFQSQKSQGQIQDTYSSHDPRIEQLQQKLDQGIQNGDPPNPIAAPVQADDYILQTKQDIAAQQLYANAYMQSLYEKLHKASGFSLARQIPRIGMRPDLKSLPGVSVQLPHKQKRLKESAEHQLSAVGVYWTVSDHIVRYVDQRSDLYTKVFQGDVFVSEDDLEPSLARARRINFGIEQTPTTVDFIQYGQLHSYTCMRHPVSWFSPWFQHLLMSTY
jgi:hypothetical protein